LGLKKLFSHVINLTDKGWKTASYVWGVYFLCTGTINEIIRQFGTKRMWVDFKIFVIFITISLALLLSVYLKDQKSSLNK
jgi:intracellular septation protein A